MHRTDLDAHTLATIDDRDRLYARGNDAGEGYAVGDQDSNINELAEEIGGTLIHRAETDDDVAVYQTSEGFVIVGDSHGPWAVAV